METTGNTIFPESRKESVLRRRNLPTSFFIAALLLFFMPFAELDCGKYTLAGNSGIGLATGRDWRPTSGKETSQFLKDFSPDKPGNQLPVSSDPNIFLLVAMAAGLAGIFISVTNYRIRPAAIFCAGLVAVLMMIAAMIQLKMILRTNLQGAGAIEAWDKNVASLLKIRFTLWYFASVASFAVASFIGYRQHIFMLQDALDRSFRFEFQEKDSSSALTGST
jgi:hypothetical protein